MAKVLFLGALPDGTTSLRLDRELKGIEQALTQAGCRDRLVFTTVWASTFADLMAELQRVRPDIVHFSGHGTPEALLFERRDGKAGTVSAEALTRLFAALPTRLVVLNACDSLGLATALAAHVECAVGTTEPIGDQGAVLFAAAFYRALALGSSVAHAAELGRVAVLGANLQGADDVQVVGATDRPFLNTSTLQPRGGGRAGTTASLHALTEPPAVGRLRALITAVLVGDPTLCARLAAALDGAADPDSLTNHCMGLSVEALIDPLLTIAQESTEMRLAAARLAQVVLPAATDWQAFRAAQQEQMAGTTVHLEVPFLIGPLCEVVVAAAQDRAAQLEHRDQISAAVPMPSLNLLAVLPDGKALHLAVAESILLQRRRRDQLPKDPARLLEEARKFIAFRREKLAPDKRYQMYLVFENAEPGALRALAGGLPDLWLVQGRRDDDQTLLDTLHELFGWS